MPGGRLLSFIAWDGFLLLISSNSTRHCTVIDWPLPPFRPHPLLRGPHRQTIAGSFLPGARFAYAATRHRVELDDGDALVLHDDRPPTWHEGDPAALLLHGLAGCHLSPYMVRVAGKLAARGVRAFRLDFRGCGAGAGLARLPYHAGRSDDVLAAIERIEALCPGSAIGLAGFSLGGNVALKLLGEAPQRLPAALSCAVAVSPPIAPAAAVERMTRSLWRAYDRHFTKLLGRRVLEMQRNGGPANPASLAGALPRSLRELDERLTAPMSGFRDADDYYERVGAVRFLAGIALPTLIVTSRDDPLIPVSHFERPAAGPAIRLCITEEGGHLGFVARRGTDPDCRWMEWRVVDWLCRPPSPASGAA
ncbi:MAG: alpha/beta fold hydrolase [Planctomycetales bacterium]